jgi:DNA polymerase elongation subunit (family B)
MKAVSSQGSNIMVVGRDENGQRWIVQDTSFRPYFFVLDTEANRKTLVKRGLEHIQGPKGIDDRQTLKVYVSTPDAVGKRRRGFDFTYEADVPYTRRYLVDKGIKDGFIVKAARQIGKDMLIVTKPGDIIPVDYRNPDRQFLYDIETNKPEGSNHYSPPVFARGAVTCNTVHDTFDGTNFHTFAWHPKLGQKGKPVLHVKNRFSKAFNRHVDWFVNIHGTEYEMFEAMLAFHKERRPDVESAWNGHLGWKKFMKSQGGFDKPYLINRAKNLRINPGMWSPLNNAFAGYKNFGKEADKGRFDCYVDGVQLVDSQCVGAGHLILRPDLTWTKAGDLKVGDKVASFDEFAANADGKKPRRNYTIGTVTRNIVKMQEAFEVELNDGTKIITTDHHPWLVKNYDNMHKWVETRRLMRANTRVQKVIDRYELDPSREMAWLAGILDGEGSLKQLTGKNGSRCEIQISQNPGLVLDEIQRILKAHEYKFSQIDRADYDTGSINIDMRIQGGREESLRLLQETRPIRLLNKFRWENMGFVMVKPENRIGVKSVTPIGRRPIANLTVDSATYIVEGFLMHNTSYQVKDGGFVAQVPYSDLKRVIKDKLGYEMNKEIRKDIGNWWLHDFWEFAEYSFDDVDAIVGLEKKENYTEWIRNIQQFVGAEDANRLFTPMSLISSLNLRLAQDQLDAVVPTSGNDSDSESDDYSAEGGFVMPPQRYGVQQNMALLDLSAMYVNIIRSCNISWETWVPNPTDAEIDDLICVPSDLGPQFFMKPERKVGLMPLSCGYLIQWRRTYDVLIKAEKDADKSKALEKARDPAKQLVLAVFGTSLSEFFSLFRPEVGSSITGMGRHIITGVDRFLKAHGYFVQYSDTDSCFVPLKSTKKEDLVTEGQELCRLINEWFTEMAADLGVYKHSLEIGMDTILSPFVQGQQKKSYAGMVTWKKGHWQDSPKMLVKGVPGIKSDATKITKDVTETVLRMILTNQPLMDVVEYIRDVYESVLAGQVPIEDIVKAVGLSTHPDDDLPKKNWIHTAARRGQEMYDFAYNVGAKVSIVKLKGAEKQKIAIPEGEDIPEGIPIDWDAHATLAILKPLRGIMSWVGLEDMLEGVRHGTELTRSLVLE